MKKRMRMAAGYAIKVISILGGIYLMVITFGMEPLITIEEIWCKENSEWICLGKTFLQLLKMVFGIGYTFLAMVVFYRIGDYLIEMSTMQNNMSDSENDEEK